MHIPGSTTNKEQKIIGHQPHVVYNEKKQCNKACHLYGYILTPDIFCFTHNFSTKYLKFPFKSKFNSIIILYAWDYIFQTPKCNKGNALRDGEDFETLIFLQNSDLMNSEPSN